MRYIIFLLTFSFFSHLIYAQQSQIDTTQFLFKTRAEKKEEKRQRRNTKMNLWRAKPYHAYLGVDVMESIRLQQMKFTNKPADVSEHNRKYDGMFSGNLAIRVYLGLMIKTKNCVEISIENFPHQITFDYKPDPTSYGSEEYRSTASWAFYSVAYKRDVLPRSKILKLYTGAFIGICYVGNAGFLDTFSLTSVLNGNVSAYSHIKFYKMPVLPIIGPSIDADVNFWRFTIGLKFRLYWEPWSVWGKDVIVKYNNGPAEKFRVESSVLNFNWGLGLRYTF
jgi:hypothetical protein